MENITIINNFLQILFSTMLIYYVFKNSKLVKEYNKLVTEKDKLITEIENKVYDIADLKGIARPKLFLDQTISDIFILRKKAVKFDNIINEYEKLVIDYPKLEKEKHLSEEQIERLNLDINDLGEQLRNKLKDLEETKEENRILNNNNESFKEYVENNYERFSELAKALDIEFSKGRVIILEDFTKKIKTMFLTIWNLKKIILELDAHIKNKFNEFNKRIHVKDQIIYELRKKLAEIKENKKTGQYKINK